jgi:8-oxo-dGTP diphosphatase
MPSKPNPLLAAYKALGVSSDMLTGPTDYATSSFALDKSGKLGHHDAADMTEEEFLAAYEVKDYPRPSVTADLVIFTIVDSILHVLLIQRDGHPFRGYWALPGGFVDVGDAKKDQGEDIYEAAERELEEETGLPKGSCYLEQLYTFGAPYRDPRTRTITVAYFALVRSSLAALVVAGDDAAQAKWVPVQELLDAGRPLAFDHGKIIAKAVERIRGRIDYSPIAFDLVPDTFTATDLRVVYEAVKGQAYDAKNFYRRFRRMQADGIIVPAPGARATGNKRAAVYRFVR